jgi:hypothetical protein
MDETSQPKQLINNNEFNNLMKKLEKEGESKVKELLNKNNNSNFVSSTIASGLTNGSVPIQKPSSDFGNSLINIMSAGADEFKEKTGRNMTYSEMRQLYG